MMKLMLTPIAVKDLQGIKKYIAEDNEDIAVKTVQSIFAQIEYIQQFPHMGTDVSKRIPYVSDYKYVNWVNYVIIYKIENEYVQIYRVINRYQDITLIF